MSGPRTATHEAVCCGVPTRFVLTVYTNRIMVVVTQTSNMGTLLMASADDPLNPTSNAFSVRVLLGRRDDEMLEAYARSMVELIWRRAPDSGPLLLAISIREHSPDMFRAVLREVEEHRLW